MLTIAYPSPTGPLSRVRSFEYVIGSTVTFPGINSAIANSSADLIFLGAAANLPPLDRSAADPAGTKLIFGYLDVCEAAAFEYPSLFATNPLPSWFGNLNPGYPGLYTVQYWNPAWEPILFQAIDTLVANGYDGIFLDVLNGNLEWSAGNPEGNPVYPNALSAMQTLVSDLKNYVTTTYPNRTIYLVGNFTGVTGNNGLLKDLDGIFNEIAYYGQTPTNGFVSAPLPDFVASFLTTTDSPIFAASGLPVFGNDYPNPLSDTSADFLSFDLYSALGWVPSVTTAQTTASIFASGPFMFMAKPSNSTVTGYPNFVNFLSGGEATNAILIGGNQGDFFIGGPGQNRITGGSGNDTIYAHPKNAAENGELIFEFSSTILGTGTTPSVSISVNGQAAVQPTQITAAYGTNTQTIVVDATTYLPISSVQIVVSGTKFSDQNNLSFININSARYSGVIFDLTTGVYSDGSASGYLPFSSNGTVTFPASNFWVTSPFASNTSDVIDGGGGTNTVVYRGPMSNYTVTKQNDGSWLVTSKATAEGPDTLKNIQVLQFSDQQIALQ